MKKTIYYSVSNGGDGSAYPHFFEDKDCAEIHQELMEDGWGEPCTGSVEIETDVDCQIKIKDIITLDEYIKTLEEELDETSRKKRKTEITEYIKDLKAKKAKDFIEKLEI
jgi:hypothetical protein